MADELVSTEIVDTTATEIAETPKKEVAQSPQNNAYDSPFASKDEFNALYTIGGYFAKSEVVPKSYQGRTMDCAIAVDIANRMGVSPLMVMQNLYIVQGRPTWSGQACMSLIRGSGLYKEVKPVYVGKKDSDEWGCYIEAVDKSTGETVKGTTVTMKMAKDEGWYGKTGSKWKTMPEQMLAYRAAAFFARVYTPNALMGISVEGEPEDIAEEKFEATDVYADTEGRNNE